MAAPSTLAAVVIGATGATGKCLVRTLLTEKDKVSKVTILTRRKVESVEGVDVSQEESEGRLIQHVQDLDEVTDEKVKELCTGSHVFFNCLGTTRARAGSADAFRHIDMEIPARLAKAAREAGVPHCSVLTSAGSNPNSWFLYTKTKGQLEDQVRAMGFSYTTILRPGLLERNDPENSRFFEKVANALFKGLPVSQLAEAMFHDAWNYFSNQPSSTSEAASSEAASSEAASSKAAANSVIFFNSDIRRITEEAKK